MRDADWHETTHCGICGEDLKFEEGSRFGYLHIKAHILRGESATKPEAKATEEKAA